jgi:hypothetical protein
MRAYCQQCRQVNDYVVLPSTLHIAVENQDIEYFGHKALCMICSHEVSVHEIILNNLSKLKSLL